MEQQGLIAQDKKVVEREPRGRRDIRDLGRDAINVIRNLVDLRFHLILPLVRSSSRASDPP
jgi:hypothetical protein